MLDLTISTSISASAVQSEGRTSRGDKPDDALGGVCSPLRQYEGPSSGVFAFLDMAFRGAYSAICSKPVIADWKRPWNSAVVFA